jgi:hypothetical protein
MPVARNRLEASIVPLQRVRWVATILPGLPKLTTGWQEEKLARAQAENQRLQREMEELRRRLAQQP